MAWTLLEYEALKKAVSSGILSVRYNDRTVVYQSLKDMRDLLASMEAELNPSNTNGTRYRVAATRKGV